MSGKTKEFNPYSITLEVTSDYNLFYARSSNGWDVYGVLLTGEGSAVCSCPAGSVGMNCKHRISVLARHSYVTPGDVLTDSEWQEIQFRIENAACKEAADRLFGREAA